MVGDDDAVEPRSTEIFASSALTMPFDEHRALDERPDPIEYFHSYQSRRSGHAVLAAPLRARGKRLAAPSTRRGSCCRRLADPAGRVRIAIALLVDGDDDRSGAVGLRQLDLIAAAARFWIG